MKKRNELKIKGEYQFEITLMTNYSQSPMTVEVSKINIDGVLFMLVRLLDADGDVQVQFTDVLGCSMDVEKWIDGLCLNADDMKRLDEEFKNTEFYDYFEMYLMFDEELKELKQEVKELIKLKQLGFPMDWFSRKVMNLSKE